MLLNEYTPGEAEIFARILNYSQGSMSRSLARNILKLGFSDADQARMLDLAERNQEDKLTKAEHRELFDFVRAGHLLAQLHARARLALKMPLRKPARSNRG